jgi:hypothetical protein
MSDLGARSRAERREEERELRRRSRSLEDETATFGPGERARKCEADTAAAVLATLEDLKRIEHDGAFVP